MASDRELITGEQLKKQKSFNLTTVTNFPAMVIQYIGPKLFAKITVAAGGDITIYADDVDGATTSYYTADLSTPAAGRDTFGELDAEINADPNLRCCLVGVLPSEPTDNTLAAVTGANIRTDDGYTLLIDQTVLLDTGFSITNERFYARPSTGWAGKYSGRTFNHAIGNPGAGIVENSLDYIELTITAVGAGTTKVYSVNPVDNTATIVYSDAFVSATKETKGDTPTPQSIFVKAMLGHRLVVKFDNVSAATTAADIVCNGTSKHLVGGDVYGANFIGCDGRTT